jgi:hypothetical protein
LSKPLRLLLSIFAVLSLGVALAACGDDDDADTDDTTTTTGAEDQPTDEGEEGAPEENPCAPGASGELGESAAPADDATEVAVTAREYEFEGGDELMEQGTYALTLTNDGEELHEAAIVRLAEGETRSLEELIGADEEPELTEVAMAFACPGTSAEPISVEIDEPGRYVMACFIPVGTLPTTDFATLAEDAPPHAAQGMIKEWTVS